MGARGGIFMAEPSFYGITLRRGASGPDVALVQRWLNSAHDRYPAINTVTVDGRYGPATVSAVRSFQTAAGLNDDGAVGEDTWDLLYAAYAQVHGEGEIWPGITMRTGMRGATVKSAQERLKTLVPHLSTDGRYGLSTRNAVFAWQVVHDLPADGALDHRTWNDLYGVSTTL